MRYECGEQITFVQRASLYCAYSYTPETTITLDKVMKYLEPQKDHNDIIK